MPLFAPFCGGSYTTRSANIDAEATINLYFEATDSAANPKKGVLYGTPGLLSLTVTTDTVCRGMFSQGGRTFAVIGGTLFEVFIAGSGLFLVVTTINRASIPTDGKPVFMATNGAGGNQLAIVSVGVLYIFNLNTNVLSAAIVTPLTNLAGPVIFLNGYFLLMETNSLNIWFSALEDGTLWNGLDFFTRSNTSDNFVGMVVLHDQIKGFGSKTAEIYYNEGEADNPFLPYPGSISMDGAISQFACKVIGESIVWVSKNEWDVVRAMRAGSGEATVISTPAVEFAWASYPTVSDVELECYEQEGHPFAVFTFPSADKTWVYDLREALWHQRDSRDSLGVFHRWRARGLCAPGNQAVLCGDYLTGNIYALSLECFDENCTMIRRLRRAPYLGPENQWLYLDQVELGLQAGVQIAAGPNQGVGIQISRDFATTFNGPLYTPEGVAGTPLTRAIWRRLGRARQDQLVIQVIKTDPTRTVWGPGLWLRVSDGSGML